MAGNWWITDQGGNTLLTLPESLIIDFLWRHPGSRNDFESLVATMGEEEIARFQALIDAHPYVKTKTMSDPQAVSDAIQSKHNRAGVRTRKPRRK